MSLSRAAFCLHCKNIKLNFGTRIGGVIADIFRQKHTSRERKKSIKGGREKVEKVSQAFSSVRYISGEDDTLSEPEKEYKKNFTEKEERCERLEKGDEMNIIL